MALLPSINRLLSRAWRAGALPEPVLELATIEEAALRRKLGQGFGEVSWREPLERLLSSLEREADLNPLGRAMAYGQIVRLARERLRAERLWEWHPEIAHWPVEAPVIVVGQMRSGTTRLQRLLACDARFAHTRLFETMSPAPRGHFDTRVFEAWAGLRAMRALNPETARIHPTAARSPEEEFGLFSLSFYGAQIEAQWRVPSFSRYWEEADRRPVYRDFRRLVQTIAWANGDRRPRVMKAPQFMEDLERVLESFPGARLICLSRDPTAVVASSASLVWNQMRVQSDSADQGWIGAEWLRKTALREKAAAAVRRRDPEVPQIDVSFEAMERDWRGEMRRIYDFLGLPLTSEVERRMEAYLAQAERSGFRGHRYGLEEFGLDRETVEAAMTPSGRP